MATWKNPNIKYISYEFDKVFKPSLKKNVKLKVNYINADSSHPFKTIDDIDKIEHFEFEYTSFSQIFQRVSLFVGAALAILDPVTDVLAIASFYSNG